MRNTLLHTAHFGKFSRHSVHTEWSHTSSFVCVLEASPRQIPQQSAAFLKSVPVMNQTSNKTKDSVKNSEVVLRFHVIYHEILAKLHCGESCCHMCSGERRRKI